MSFNALYNQVGGNFASANDRLQHGKYARKAISAYSLLPVDASDYQFTYLSHANPDYPKIRFERRQMALIPASPEARAEFVNWFFRCLLAGERKPTPANGAAYVAPRRRHADMCARLEATYSSAPVQKKRRLVGAKDEDSSEEEEDSSEEEESSEDEVDENGDLADFVVPDDCYD